MTQQPLKSYRPDIDGLRAFAIVPIILYHFGFKFLFGGGFVGVDIFFVISGYLITKNIHKEINNNSFSIVEFYEKRIRRIIPAFSFMLFFCIIISSYIYYKKNFNLFLESALSAIGMVSNFYFWADGDYFSPHSDTKPLLHTWSLGIEEQFYLLFPLIMIYFFRNGRNLLGVLYSIFFISFIASVIIVFFNQDAAFYNPITRAWELLLGAIIAICRPEKKLLRKKQYFYIGYLGIFLIALSIIGYGYIDNLLFPGLAAVPPCLGTALCIVAGSCKNEYNPVTKFLSFKPFVVIGLLSYSLYLWHWPIYVFYYTINFRPEPSAYDLLILLTATIIMSGISYFFIEKPIRQKIFWGTKAGLYKAFLTYLFAILSLISFFKFTDVSFTNSKVNELYSQLSYGGVNHSTKLSNANSPLEGKIFLENTTDISKAKILFIGNSFASMYAKTFVKMSKELSIPCAFIVDSGPKILTLLLDEQKDSLSKDAIKFKEIIEVNKFQAVVLSIRFVPNYYGDMDLSESYALYEKKLRLTISFMQKQGIKVFAVNQTPIFKYHVPNAAAKLLLSGNSMQEIENRLACSYTSHLDESAQVNAIIQRLENIDTITLDPIPYLCNERLCHIAINGKLLYYDQAHLSFTGTEFVKNIFKPVFNSIQ